MRTTLQILDEKLEQEQDSEHREHHGASQAGAACQRKVWYSFRHALKPKFDAKVLRRFRDGHESEEIIAKELAKVVVLTDRQARFQDGHVGGSVDGIIESGLVEAPNERHIWEHKCTSEERFTALVRLIDRMKGANRDDLILEKWEQTYYVQAQIYMKYFDIKWHYLTVASAGSRDLVSIRTPYDRRHAEHYAAQASELTLSHKAPPRVTDDRMSYNCRFCSYNELCHGEVEPDKHCRSCLAVEPTMMGEWGCRYHLKSLSKADRDAGCRDWRRFLDLG